MKYSKIKNVLLAIIPACVFYIYQEAQIRLRMIASINFRPLSYKLFNIFAPCLVGLIAFFLIAYAYQNRHTLVFISLFCGGLLVNLLYIVTEFGLFGLHMAAIEMSSASQIAYLLMGAYLAGFWVSLISYIVEKSKQRK
ncbi:MAG: hypothetical protein GX222_00660 [Ruminococcaceae bacterium]|nr:hypothetical protein [Oscillospiraceae bacterium]